MKTSAKWLFLVVALWMKSAIADNHGMASTAEPGVFPSFEEVGIATDEFEIKFSNIHIIYKMAVFPSDKHFCENAFLFVFIPTRPSSFEIREAIRSSWVGDRPIGVAVKFVVGLPKNAEVFDAMLEEQNVFGDLIMYDIEDTYENLILKVHAAFNWQQAYCAKAEYILKTDDDTIVDLHRLLYWIERDIAHYKLNQPAIICGGIWKKSIPLRNKKHKWYVPYDVFPGRHFPDYANGPTYLLSNQAVSAILAHAPIVDAFTLEDALYTGVVSDVAGVHRRDIWKYFRFGDKIGAQEKCDKNDRVPHITAVYGHYSVVEYAEKYQSLKNVRCSN
uniref:Hexosyltransferase n=1 Tax=Ditylenchus dipsaci TaxID=166011 RepID=A0A915EMH5_9BILA